MDIGTAKDFIEDLQHEVLVLHKEIDYLQLILAKAFVNGHQPHCKLGMWCDCGYMLYEAHMNVKKADNERTRHDNT
jgi:hypothetical protein